MALLIEEEAIESLPITIDPEFLDNLPTISRDQVLAVLKFRE